MRLTSFLSALLLTTALTGVALAQTAPAANPAPAPDAPKAKVRDKRAESGMTSAPTDLGRIDVNEGAGGTGVTPGGVTRQDLGGGNMIQEDAQKTRSTVTRDAIDKQAPTANPFQLINILPGVNMASTDAAGLNSSTITIHGFQSNQIGMTIEGAPVNDSGNYALYPSEYLDAENIGSISIAQGQPDLDSPHIGATGGVINVYLRDPAKTPGGFLEFTTGSHNLFREFARFDTGEVHNFRAFLSFSDYYRGHWVGEGNDTRTHVDFKGVYDIDAASRMSLAVVYNHMLNNAYANPTLAQFHTPGYIPAYPTTGAGTSSSYYGYKINPFKNVLVSAPGTFAINNQLTFDTIPYFWYGIGSGGGVTSATEEATGAPGTGGLYMGTQRITGIDFTGDGVVTSGQSTLLYNPSITETWRPGIINKITYTPTDHRIVFGHFLEYATQFQYGTYAMLGSDGSIKDPFQESGAIIGSDGLPLEKRDALTTTLTNVVFAGDSWNPNGGKYTFDFGVKQAFVNRNVSNFMPGASPFNKVDNMATLPQGGVRYQFNEKNQVFASVGTTFRTTPNYVLRQDFSNQSGMTSTPPNTTLNPERAVTIEVGHRYQGETIATSLSGFYTSYENHQVSSNGADPSGGSGQVSLTLNAGRVHQVGVDFEAGTRPILGGLRPYVSAEYLQTQIMDNLPAVSPTNVADLLPTAGKQLPMAPHFIGAIGLDYDNGHYLANLTVKYTGSQYSTLMNDESIHGFARADAMVGYRFDDIGPVKAPEIRLNLFNLTNARQLIGVNGVQSNALTTTGVNGNPIAGATPNYIQGEGFAAIGSVRVAF